MNEINNDILKEMSRTVICHMCHVKIWTQPIKFEFKNNY